MLSRPPPRRTTDAAQRARNSARHGSLKGRKVEAPIVRDEHVDLDGWIAVPNAHCRHVRMCFPKGAEGGGSLVDRSAQARIEPQRRVDPQDCLSEHEAHRVISVLVARPADILYRKIKRTVVLGDTRYSVDATLFCRRHKGAVGVIGDTPWQFGKFSSCAIDPTPSAILEREIQEIVARDLNAGKPYG